MVWSPQSLWALDPSHMVWSITPTPCTRQGLKLARPWAQASCHDAWPNAHWACNLDPDIPWGTIRASPDQLHLGQECDCSRVPCLGCRYCLREYHCRTTFWRWEPVPMPLLPLPMEHPLKNDRIGPLFPLIIRNNHNTSTYLKL